MRKLLNTLFVTTQGSYLSKDGETILVRVENETRLQVPVHTIGGIVCLGNIMCSPPLMALCAEHGVLLSFLSENGRFLARVQGSVSGNVLLRREQYRRADDEGKSAVIAQAVVVAKIANCRVVLLRCAREHPELAASAPLEKAADELYRLMDGIRDDLPLDTVRGVEGDAARQYFSAFDNMIAAQKKDFMFVGRSRRPPLDNVNALLSFVYTLLVHDITSALETVGLDPCVGFLHRDRPGRPSLALDMMEEFRPFLGDRLVLSLINRQQVQGSGFQKTESGGVLMDEATRKEVILAYQKRKTEEIQHPFLCEKVQIGLLPFIQALLLSRFLRGDLDGYPPFFWR
ncbi:MAG: type I-C CRISPR-associated endonuclease Cas1c [Candidatus Brocadiia bacterium]